MVKSYPIPLEWAERLRPLKESPEWEALKAFLQHKEDLLFNKLRALQSKSVEAYGFEAAQMASISRFIKTLVSQVEMAPAIVEAEQKRVSKIPQ